MFYCKECWNEFSKWAGQCSFCKSWNSIVEHKELNLKKNKANTKINKLKSIKLINNNLNKEISNKRYSLESQEITNVLWWWLVPWSFILLSGEPWIWKSTITLQIANWCAVADKKVLYASWEETWYQIINRAKRLNIENSNIEIITSTVIEDILKNAEINSPDVLIVDSVSVMMSNDSASWFGSISQVKAIAEKCMHFAKKTNTVVILIWHITKDWDISWPKTLEHLVDVVLFLEWNRFENYRILRTFKNRFWPSDEIWMFKMTETWLQDVLNPALMLLEEHSENINGASIWITIEWTRPIFVEVESLTTITNFWYPKRSSRWIWQWKIDLLIAAINKFCSISLENYDVYINISRWFSVKEPAIDLAILASILSSRKNKSLNKTIFIWEISLTGLIKNVSQLSKRVSEAVKLWFTDIVIPYNSKLIFNKKINLDKVKIHKIKNVQEFEKKFF